jgi:hypothetical protein
MRLAVTAALALCTMFAHGQSSTAQSSVIEYTYDRMGNIIKMDVSGQLQEFDFYPESGPERSTVVLAGAGFSADSATNRAWIGGLAATVSQSTRRELRIVIPDGAQDGVIRVEVDGVSRESREAFDVLDAYPAPLIDGLEPRILLPGDQVAVTGRYFVQRPSGNQLTTGPSTQTITTADSNRLGFEYPAGVGSARLVVRTEHGEGSAPQLIFVPPDGTPAAAVAIAEEIAVGQQQPVSLRSGEFALLAYEVPDDGLLEASIVGASLRAASVQLVGPDRQVISTTSLSASGGTVGLRAHDAGSVYTLAITPRPGYPLVAQVAVGHRDLEITDLTLGEVAATSKQQYQIPVSFSMTNRGTLPVHADWYHPVRIRAYLSTDDILAAGDPELTGAPLRTTPIAAGESLPVQALLTTGAWPGTGDRHLFIKVDAPSGTNPTAQGVIPEPIETNNVVTGGTRLNADLTISEVTVGDVSATGDGRYALPVTYTVSNRGSSAISVDYYRPIAVAGFLSTDASLSSDDQRLSGGANRSTRLGPGESYTESKVFYTSAAITGDLNFLLKVDAPTFSDPTGPALIVESDEANNTVSMPVQLKADLAVSDVEVGEVSATGDGRYSFPATFTVSNLGNSRINVDWYKPMRVRAFLSRDLELSTGDPELSGVTNRTTPIEPGESYIETRTLFTSSYPETGDWNLIIKVDAPALGNPALPGSVSETNETNNTSLGMPVQLKADLAVSDVEVGEVSATGDGRYSFPATFTVSNLGNSRINVDWYKPMRVRAFLSRDLELSTGDPELSGVTNRTTPIEPGESYIETRTLFTSSYPETGDWNLIIKVDAPAFGNPALQGSVSETNETNNTSLGNVQLQADLTISDLLVGTVSDAGGGRYSFPVTYTVRNIGSSRITVDYYKPIRMSAYLSRDADISSSDLALSGLLSRSSPMAPGESFTETRTVTSMANPGSGQWTVLIKVDAPLGANPAVNGTIAESNEQNNVVSAGVQLP